MPVRSRTRIAESHPSLHRDTQHPRGQTPSQMITPSKRARARRARRPGQGSPGLHERPIGWRREPAGYSSQEGRASTSGPACQRALRNAPFRTGPRPQYVVGHVCCAVGRGQSGERARSRRQGRSAPRSGGGAQRRAFDGGEHTRTLSASTAPAYHNILWSTASEKPAYSCARQHLPAHGPDAAGEAAKRMRVEVTERGRVEDRERDEV